jgi:hypothetical protein
MSIFSMKTHLRKKLRLKKTKLKTNKSMKERIIKIKKYADGSWDAVVNRAALGTKLRNKNARGKTPRAKKKLASGYVKAIIKRAYRGLLSA